MTELQPLPGTGLPDRNRGPEILAMSGSLTAISGLFVAVRLYVRLRMTKNVSWDDWFCLFAWIIVFVQAMLFIPEVQYGAGRHVAYINPKSNIPNGLKINFVTQLLVTLAINVIKISIGLFLLRLTPSINFTRIVKFTIAFTCVTCIAQLLFIANQCRPLPYTRGEGEGSCIPGARLRFGAFFTSALAVLTDLIFALLPIPMLYKVQVNWRVKVAICGILSLGLLAASAALVKTHFLYSYGMHGDFLYDGTEVCIGIIAACAPSLKPLFKAILHGSSYAQTYPSRLHSGFNQHRSKHNSIVGEENPENDVHRAELYGARESGRVTITSGQRKDKLNPINISEESFLPMQNLDRVEGIRKTMQVSVHSDKAYPPTNVEDRV